MLCVFHSGVVLVHFSEVIIEPQPVLRAASSVLSSVGELPSRLLLSCSPLRSSPSEPPVL